MFGRPLGVWIGSGALDNRHGEIPDLARVADEAESASEAVARSDLRQPDNA
jgi:hypothetical protein